MASTKQTIVADVESMSDEEFIAHVNKANRTLGPFDLATMNHEPKADHKYYWERGDEPAILHIAYSKGYKQAIDKDGKAVTCGDKLGSKMVLLEIPMRLYELIQKAKHLHREKEITQTLNPEARARAQGMTDSEFYQENIKNFKDRASLR